MSDELLAVSGEQGLLEVVVLSSLSLSLSLPISLSLSLSPSPLSLSSCPSLCPSYYQIWNVGTARRLLRKENLVPHSIGSLVQFGFRLPYPHLRISLATINLSVSHQGQLFFGCSQQDSSAVFVLDVQTQHLRKFSGHDRGISCLLIFSRNKGIIYIYHNIQEINSLLVTSEIKY